MTSISTRYKGYTIHVSDLSGTPTVSYQSPFWPADPRIVKCPGVETAKRWIREECRRVAARTRKFQFLLKLDHCHRLTIKGKCRRTVAYVIVDKEGACLVRPYFDTAQEARDYAESQDFALFEHFNY